MDALFGTDALTTTSAGTAPLPQERQALRRACELSVYQVASACSVSEAAVRAWEHGTATPSGDNAAAYGQLLQGLRAYVTKTPLDRAAVPLPDWAALGALRHRIPFRDSPAPTCWRCHQPTSQRVGGMPQHLGTRCPDPHAAAPLTEHLHTPERPRVPAPRPANRVDYPARGRSTAAGPLAVLAATASGTLTAHLTGGSTLTCPAEDIAQLLAWTTTAGLGAPAVKAGGLNAGPLLVLTGTATTLLSLPPTPPSPAQRHPRSDHPVHTQLRAIGWQTSAQGLGPWTTVHPAHGDPTADGIHLAITAWGALHNDTWRLPAHLSPPQIAQLLGAYTYLLRTPIGPPGECGHRLMSDLRPPEHRHAHTNVLLCHGAAGALTQSVDPAPCEAPDGHRLARGRTAEDRMTVEDIDWWRPPIDSEATAPYVACLAVNLSHVADSNNIRVAAGPARTVQHPAFHRKTPGSWFVDLSGTPQHPHLPAPYVTAGPAWHPTEAVTYAQQRGASIHPTKGHLRTGTAGPYLNPWYQRIRDARVAALGRLGITPAMQADTLCHALEHLDEGDPVSRLLLDAVDATAAHSISVLAQQPDDPDHIPGHPFDTPPIPTWRPDLRASLIANARANIHRKLGMTARTGYFPLAVHQDHILFATHTPSILEIINQSGSGFRLGISPGQVSPAGTRTMTWYLHHCAQQINPAQLLRDAPTL
ncbi:helix-turn-helix transcriptional regulator [Streptomyces sp. NPDC002992]|uniref:helix-turn-helix domain-containing protein n=1 Tax=Streptomyces sp. NPDC002992 TaxID=3154273 RepID=UPI0033B61389